MDTQLASKPNANGWATIVTVAAISVSTGRMSVNIKDGDEYAHQMTSGSTRSTCDDDDCAGLDELLATAEREIAAGETVSGEDLRRRRSS